VRILRLALRHYRGVAERELHFAPHGVTIVAGPNEVGKSSLAEALELLFDELDSTTKQRVREVQAIDRDEGAEVEVDVETGPYAFTYAKRFHRRPATRLALRRPRVETRTGREAHERVREILDETLDVALWRALRLQQGAPLVQPELGDAPSLAAALDRAAGTGGGGEREESVFDAAREACERHYTPTGRPRRERVRAEEEARAAREDEDALREQLDAVERDALRERELKRRAAELEARVAGGREALREVEAELETVRALGEQVSRLEAQRDAALARETEAVQAARARGQLLTAHAGALADLESLSETLESEEPAYVAAGAERRHVEERLEQARAAQGGGAARAQLARRDAAFRRAERELGGLRERAERVAREEREMQRAREILAGPAIDAARVQEIQAAQLAVDRARARLAAEGPTVSLDAERDLTIEVDGRRVAVRAGERASERVGEAWSLSLPGVGEITVVAGAGVAERRKVLEQAETALRSLCAEVGVDDHAGAIAALEARRSAEHALAASEGRLAEARGDTSSDELAARIRHLEERVARYADERTADTPLPATLDAAEAGLEAAETAAARARDAVETLSARYREQNARFERYERHRSDTQLRLDLAEQSAADLGGRLAAARAAEEDRVLEERRDARSAEARELEARAREARSELESRAPDATRARAEQVREALEADERALRETRDTLLRLAERLEVVGREGLFERRETARVRRVRAERDLAARRRRAAAARRLHDVLREERDAARRSYAAPLAARIAGLGRPLFGPTFEVDLSDDLRVERRVLDGTSLALSQLSAGAREQLALLARLAAAQLAGGSGAGDAGSEAREGVPLLLDDALGHTDAERLAAVGPVLARAGETGQVIVLTCAPERFRGVAGARVVELR